MKSVYSALRTGSFNKGVCASSLKGKRRKYSKMDKGAKDKLAGSPGENGGG